MAPPDRAADDLRPSPEDRLEQLRASAARAGLTPSSFRLPVERHVVVGRMRLSVLDWGNNDAPPIVFVHGGSLTAHTWDLVSLSLCDSYRCLALDLRGHGDSEWPPDADYRIDTIAHDVIGLIETMDLHRPVLVGMSLGGLASIALAGRRSDLLRGLVIVDVGPDVRREGAARIIDFVRNDQELDSIDQFVDRAVQFNARRDPALLRRSLLHNLRRLPTGKYTWKWDPRRHRDSDFERMRAEHASLWEVVPNISVPTLIVRGADSAVFLREDADRLTAALPDASWVEVANAGHTVQGDNAGGLLEAISPFLQRHLESAGGVP